MTKRLNPIQQAQLDHLQLETRRLFLKQCGYGLGAMALNQLFGCSPTPKLSENTPLSNSPIFDPSKPLLPRAPHFAPKAKAVIYIHLAGAPSQLELFDYKPALNKLDGQDCPQSFLEGKKFAFIRGVPKMLGSQAQFKQHGESGAWISDYLPTLPTVADDLTFLKAVNTDQFNHAPAQLLMQTGSARLGRPSMGSWVTYGLGSENSNLPAFIVLNSGGRDPDAGKSVWGSGFLPSVYQGVQCRSVGEPVLFVKDPDGMSRDLRKASIEAINAINQETYHEFHDPEILSRMSQYEMAYNMQIAVPEVMTIADEPKFLLEAYGADPLKSGLANNVLLARKLVEKGVRFVQLYDWGWDAHGTGADLAIDKGFKDKCRELDRPVTALITDLKQRGLLEDTLIVVGGEFGRTPMMENRNGVEMPFKGRDHHSDAFTIFMAGGGLKAGVSHGETDEVGYNPVSGKVSVFDVQATILNQLGFDHEKFTYEYQGRPFRLTDVAGNVIREIV